MEYVLRSVDVQGQTLWPPVGDSPCFDTGGDLIISASKPGVLALGAGASPQQRTWTQTCVAWGHRQLGLLQVCAVPCDARLRKTLFLGKF